MTTPVDSALTAPGEIAPPPPRLRELLDLGAVDAMLKAVPGASLQLVEADGSGVAGVPLEADPASVRGWLAGEPVPPGWTLAPIKLRQVTLGALLVKGDNVHELAAGTANVLSHWARSHSEMHSLAGELVWRYEELSVLYDASETIVTIMDLEEVSRRILEKVKDLLDVDNASLMLVDSDSGSLHIQDAIGLQPDMVEKIRLRPGEEISGWVAKEGKPLLVEDIENHPLFKKRNKERYINRSLLSVPLKIKDRVIGVINVNNKRSGAVFNSGDLKLLSALASLAAISIENAHTYQNAITDRLTRLYNYGYFREDLQRKTKLALAEDTTVALIMFDIDHFKNFNDRNGHELANVALVRIANLCLTNSRQKGDRMPDLVARYGGEEFMILLYGIGAELAYKIAERVRCAVHDTTFKGGENQPGGRVTISMGVAVFPTHTSDPDELVGAADKALYRAKKGGRNNVQMAGA
jgi:diguanylate cyclase (GGDEF)-like protein